jgi:predicted transcriptional regulator
MRRLAEVVAGADRVRVVAPAVSPVVIRNHQQRLLDAGDHEASVTLSADAVDVALADPELRSWFRGMLETDRYDLYRYDGTIPLNLVVPDETVFVVLFDEEAGGGVHSMVESTHESVLRWAEETIERYRSDAERVGPEAFASPN